MSKNVPVFATDKDGDYTFRGNKTAFDGRPAPVLVAIVSIVWLFLFAIFG